MQFNLYDRHSHATRVVIDPETVLFIVSGKQGKTWDEADFAYSSAALLQIISNMAPSPEAILPIAVYGNTVVSIHRHDPNDGDWDAEMVEIRVGPPTGSGASLCLPMAAFRAMLNGGRLPVDKITALPATQ